MATYTWANPGTSGAFDTAANWIGDTAPGTADTAFLIGSDAALQTITGPGDVGVLDLSGQNVLAGAYTINQNLYVGHTVSGTATLDGSISIVAPSQTLSYGAVIGDTADGALVISGSGNAITDVNDNGLAVGLSANSAGSLLIAAGGTATFGSTNSAQLAAISIGREGDGTITVDGAGSTLTVNGGLYDGRGGVGALIVENSALVTQTAADTYLVIGEGSSSSNADIGGSGSATVESNATLSSQGSMRVGGFGVNGALTVSSGGLVSAVTSGTITGLAVGVAGEVNGTYEAGNGSLEIDAGGTVQIGGASDTMEVAGAAFGAEAGASGTADISGIGALLDAGANLLVIGSGGHGSISVTDGGTINASAPGPDLGAIVLGNLSTGVGVLTVSGTGSMAAANGPLTVGFQGSGTLTIADGGLITAGDVNIGQSFGSTGLVSVLGGTLDSVGTISLGKADGTGTLEIVSGIVEAPTLSVASTDTVAGTGTIDAAVDSAGTIAASGGTLTIVQSLTASGPVGIGPSSDLVLDNATAAGTTITFIGSDGRLDVLSPASFAATVADFAAGDTIFAQGAASINVSGSIVTLFDSGSTQIGTIALTGFSGAPLVDNDGTITVPCFAAGTRLATPGGAVAVELLADGDRVLTASGKAAEVRWIGHRRVDCARHMRPRDVWPVRIRPGAFGAGQPSRDLWLSPDHAVFVAGVLIPVRHLVNGRTIAQEPRDEVTYFHLELPRHDVVLAEGLPCESFLDTGNRGAFANAGASVQLQPEFALRVWAAEACAPLVLEGAALASVRARLLHRAAALGHRTSVDPELRVLADGHPVRAEHEGVSVEVRLPQGISAVRLCSRSWVPAHVQPESDDDRRLGVAVADVTLDGRLVALDSPGFAAGWHAPEPGWRWTDGDAVLAIADVRELAFDVAMTGTYWSRPREQRPRAA